jgi:hypothetical protein
MSTVDTIVIQCAACKQKNRWHTSQIGQIATCQTCGYQFLAIDPSAAIPPEFDDSIPVVRSKVPMPTPNSLSQMKASDETKRSLEAKGLARELAKELARASDARDASVDTVPARALFWGGAIVMLTALFANTSVGEMHNLSKAAIQFMGGLCGMASMICGATMMPKVVFNTTEKIGLAVWLGALFVRLVPLLNPGL